MKRQVQMAESTPIVMGDIPVHILSFRPLFPVKRGSSLIPNILWAPTCKNKMIMPACFGA